MYNSIVFMKIESNLDYVFLSPSVHMYVQTSTFFVQ